MGTSGDITSSQSPKRDGPWKRTVYLLLIPPLCIAVVCLAGCRCPTEVVTTVSFSVKSETTSLIFLQYVVVRSENGTPTETEGELLVSGPTTVPLFAVEGTTRAPTTYRFYAVTQDGENICEWSYEHQKVGRHRTLVVPSCDSVEYYDVPPGPVTRMPTRTGCR